MTHRDLELFHETGPGRSTRWARLREFQDHRPILKLQDDNPRVLKFQRSGPSLTVFRNINGIAAFPS
jgi:hypothetical protein